MLHPQRLKGLQRVARQALSVDRLVLLPVPSLARSAELLYNGLL
jgi:hypothetical protein